MILFSLSCSFQQPFHKRGAIIVRGVFAKDEIEKIYSDLKDYLVLNGDDPKDMNEAFYDVFWSKPQVRFDY